MLKGIPDIIGSDLLKALADTGHGDLIVIADHFYPPYSKSPHAVSIQAKGTNAPEMLDAILTLVPVWDRVREIVKAQGYDPACIGTLERKQFYEKAKEASITVCTSETQPYGCIILQKGVM